MNDEQLNNELDNFFRKELETLPEEQPSAREWEQMSKRIQSEGLLEKRNGRKYFLLILFALLATLLSLPFLMDDHQGTRIKNEGAISSESTKKNVSTENKISEPSKAATILTETTSTAPEIISAEAATTVNSQEPFTDKSSLHSKKGNTISRSGLGHSDDKNMGKNSAADGGNIKANSKTGEETVKTAGSTTPFESVHDGVYVKTITSGVDEKDSQAPVSINAAARDEKNTATTSAASDTQNVSIEKQPVDSVVTPLATDNKTKQDSSRHGRLRLGIYASVDYNYYTLKENKNVTQAESDYVSQSSLIEGDKWNGQYTIGIIGGYLFTQKLSLEAGAFYSQKKKLHASINTPAYASSGQEIFSDFTYDYKARYFELYGRFKYYLYQRKNSWYATVGAAGSFNLPESISSSDYFSRVSYSESSTKTENVKLDASSVGAILVISAGVEIPLGKRWDVYIEPVYRYSFSPVIKHASYDRVPVQHFMRCISLATGLMFKF